MLAGEFSQEQTKLGGIAIALDRLLQRKAGAIVIAFADDVSAQEVKIVGEGNVGRLMKEIAGFLPRFRDHGGSSKPGGA